MKQNKHSWSYLPSGKHFQTTAERHYSAFFSLSHIYKENNFHKLQLFYEAKYTLLKLFCHQPNIIG